MQVYVGPGSVTALFGRPDIQTLGIVTINTDTICRQLASDENTDKRRTNRQSKKAIQTEGRQPDSCTNNMLEVDVQIQCNANNTSQPGIDATPTVMGNKCNTASFQSKLMKMTQRQM